MKAILFYIAVAIAVTCLILLSMGQMLTPARPAPQAGAVQGGALHFDARALSHYAPSAAQYVYVNQEWFAPPTGLQIATKRTWRTPRPSTPGVRIEITPEASGKLVGRPLRISVGVLPFQGGTTARELAISVQDGGPVRWVRKPITTESGKLVFDLPASAQPIQAIGIWPFSDTKEWPFDFGVEITSVDVMAG
jgi:hypothetical protein